MTTSATGLTTKAGRAIRMSASGKPFAMTSGGYRNYKAKAHKKHGTKVHAGMSMPGKATPKRVMRKKISNGINKSLYPLRMNKFWHM
jgi:hypothetical protein